MKKYFVLDCRSTKMGAYTTMGAEMVNQSKTGNHWTERMEVWVGKEIVIEDISNSGKHDCRKIKVTSIEPEVLTEIVLQADRNEAVCPICDKE